MNCWYNCSTSAPVNLILSMSDFQVNWGIIPLLFSASVAAPSIELLI